MKFDIVAHSMGGLVSRYFLRYGNAGLPEDGSAPELTWAGAELVDKLILVGTPNAGSVKAIKQMVNGADFAPTLPRYEPALLGTMPSIYQLLPRGRHGALRDAETGEVIEDIHDPALWERMGWGLASPKQDKVLKKLLPDVADAQDRRRIALDHQAKCLAQARRFAAAMDTPAAPPPGTSIHLFVGDAVQTAAVIEAAAHGKIHVVEKGPGDGTVLRSSVLMDERINGEWHPMLISPIRTAGVHFVFTDHLGMTKDPGFSDNVLYLLLEAP